MKPPKHITKLGKEAIDLWKLQQVLGKQNETKENNNNARLDRCALRSN